MRNLTAPKGHQQLSFGTAFTRDIGMNFKVIDLILLALEYSYSGRVPKVLALFWASKHLTIKLCTANELRYSN
jgi:hypothetical protein